MFWSRRARRWRTRSAPSGSPRSAAGRAAGWRDLLLTPRSSDHHRELATPLQFCSAACLSGLPAPSSGGVRAGLRGLAGCAHPARSAGPAPRSATTDHELTFTPDHPMGPIRLRCLEPRPLPSGIRQTAGASGVVCLAFAAERYLKTLQVLAEGKAARGHKLLPLFEALPQATQADVQRRYVERLGRRRVTFLRDLAALSDTFTVWRYIYEQKPGSEIELGFLQHLVASLYEVILNSHPTWKHPNDERF